jgi:signal transduction histidine kinase
MRLVFLSYPIQADLNFFYAPLTLENFNVYNILFIFTAETGINTMKISQLAGRSGEGGAYLSTSDLTFYNAVQGVRQAGGEDHLRTDLQALLNQLVDKTKARGGLLSYNSRGKRQFLVTGDTNEAFAMTENERRLLMMDNFFVKDKTYIHPISGSGHLMGILCININLQTWESLCKELAYAYTRLAAQRFEMHRKQFALSKYVDSLYEKKRELEQIQEYNQNLLSITAHDLSSPLTAVSGYLEMIDEYLGNKESTTKLYHYYKRIQAGVSDVSDMLSQLNEVVKLKKGFSSLNSVKVEANGVIKEVCDLLEANATKKEIGLEVEVKGEAHINADVVKFKRVIYNLVTNAIKYSHKQQPIYVLTDTNNEQLYIHIRDSGPGIPEEDMNTIFDPFVRHRSEESNVTSYGLGLYISSYFTELMDGRIIAESKTGEGSTFTVIMPLASVSAN